MTTIKSFAFVLIGLLLIFNQLNIARGDIFNHRFSSNFDYVKPTNKDVSSYADIVNCAICHATALGLLDILERPQTEECIEIIAIKVCELFVHEDVTVCSSIVPLFEDEVLYLIGKLLLSPDQLCGLVLPHCHGNKVYRPRKDNQWNVTLPDTPKPPVTPPTLPPSDAPTLRVVHLSDIHYDKLYEAGSLVDCQEPLCCRLYETPTVNGSSYTAGLWGSPKGNCDIPLWTLENLFQHLQNETFDYIIWTGDLPAHNVWNQTKSDQLTAYNTLTDLFLKYFPNKKIYSAVGNHESSPVNNYPPNDPSLPKEFSISWLYDAFAQNWTNWVDKSQTATIKSIASYVDKPVPGLRIISLNTMFCYSSNYWTLLNETDPDGTLSWLVSQLQDAEDAGDKVHIIGHVLPGSCIDRWSFNYNNIIYRYESTVTGQFFGHSHSDQFAVFYEDFNSTGRPFSMYYVGPSVTTYSDRNPAYRIYTVDGNYTNSTYRVLNHQTYYLNLTEVNTSNKTDWQLEYDAKEAYGLTTLFPDDWSELITEMITNDTLYELYNTFYDREVNYDNRKYDLLCSARSAVSGYSDTLCSDIPRSSSSNMPPPSEIYDQLVERLSKLMPHGYKIDIPEQCKRSTGPPTMPSTMCPTMPPTTPSNTPPTTPSNTPPTTPMVYTTPKCDCGGTSAVTPYTLTLLLPFIVIAVLAFFTERF